MTPAAPLFERQGLLWWVLRGQWAFGLASLAFLTEVSRPALIFAAAALVAGAPLDGAGAKRERLLRFSTPLLMAAVASAAADFLLGSRDLLYSVSVLILGIQSVRLLLPKGAREGWQLSAISFLEFLASAASTTEIRFAAFALVYLGLCAGAMWALQIDGDRREGDPGVGAVNPRFAARLLLLAAAGGLLFSVVLFAVTPRVGLGQVLRGLRRSDGITGFSDTISLREVTGVKLDRRVAARIEFPESRQASRPLGLYLRGATYSRFDGKSWMRPGRYRMRVPRSGFFYVAGPPPSGARLTEAEITLEAMDNPALFVYGTPYLLEGGLGDLWTEGEGSFSLAAPGHSALRYRIRFSAEPVDAPLPGETIRQYLDIPAGLDDVRELSARITDAAGSDAERAESIMRHFRSGFRYTVTDPAASVREFLFVSKAGFCEHYATALALLLRASGIPSRLAAGYHGGEWNEPGNYLIVRQSDAHAWTEAWIGGKWVTMDATPALGELSPFFARTGRAEIYLDWMRQRWDKYVLNYSMKMQAEGVVEGRRALARAWMFAAKALAPGAPLRRHAAAAGAVFLALLVSAALYGWMAGRRNPAAAASSRDGGTDLPRRYARLIRLLAASGYRRAAGSTLEEMLMRATEDRPALAGDASRLLSLYHLDRFGAAPPPPGDVREAGRLAALLRREIGRASAE